MRTTPVPPPFDSVEGFVAEVVRRTSSKHRNRGDECVIDPCPVAACKGDKFAINLRTGAWNCPKCGNKGNAWTLSGLLGLAPVSGSPRGCAPAARVPQGEIDSRHAEEVRILQGNKEVRDYLASRGFIPETWTQALLCCRLSQHGDVPLVGFPYFRQNGRIARIKYRSIRDKSMMFWWPSKSEMPLPECSPLFMGNKLDTGAPVALTEGEYDALALVQSGHANIASVANGAKGWDHEWSEFLATANLVYCCFDADEDGNRGAGELMHKLGRERVWRVTFGEHKDANDALKAGWGFDRFAEAFLSARTEAPSILVRGKDHARRRIGELLDGTVPKPMMTGFADFDTMERGLRPGELSVLTGHSGDGKTTFALSLALGMAEMGESVGFYSFEQGLDATQDQILSMLLCWACGDAEPDRLRAVLERYPENFWLGAEPENAKAKTVVDAIRYGRVVYGTRVVVVDHLDFLIEPAPDQSAYESATKAVKALHNAAIEHGVHVMLICQPTTDSGRSKTGKPRPLRIEDIAETRAARQLAHNGFVFEADKANGRGRLYVQKARFGPARDDVTILFRFDGFRYRCDGHVKGRDHGPKGMTMEDFA